MWEAQKPSGTVGAQPASHHIGPPHRTVSQLLLWLHRLTLLLGFPAPLCIGVEGGGHFPHSSLCRATCCWLA
jgi:hypothetical protein